MRLPSSFRKLDDKVLGDRGKGKSRDDGAAHDTHDHRDSDDGDEYDDEPRTQETRTEKRGGSGGGGSSASTGKGLSEFLATVYKISRLVFLLLAAVVILGIVFVFVPVNEQNVIVRNVLSLAETVAGPFKDVFSIEDPENNVAANYGLAAGVYFLLSTLVGKLPTGGGKKSG